MQALSFFPSSTEAFSLLGSPCSNYRSEKAMLQTIANQNPLSNHSLHRACESMLLLIATSTYVTLKIDKSSCGTDN